MVLQPLIYIDETLGARVDEVLGSFASRTEAANTVLADYADMDDTKLFELLVGALLESAGDIMTNASAWQVGSVGLKTAAEHALNAAGAGNASSLHDALKVAFHFSCMKYDDDGYGVWARE